MSKLIIYQLLPRLFSNYCSNNLPDGSVEDNGSGKFNHINVLALNSIKELGVTHVWYTGIIEHATQTDYTAFGIRNDHPAVVKGKAGSPYAIRDYYDVDPDLAENVPDRISEFRALVDRTHMAGMKVIIDFVPNHVARSYHSDTKPGNIEDLGSADNRDITFSPQNNFYYLPGQQFQPHFDIGDYHEFPAKATGNDQFTASPGRNDWYETVKLNYGVDYQNGKQYFFNPIPDTWLKMRDILLYWSSFKIDGFRCDMAEMVPVEFWEWVITEVKKIYPEILFIAEVYQPAEYRNYIHRGGFDYLYDKVGLYDKLRDIVCNNHSASDITSVWQSLHGIESHMLNFLENHDEQRIASAFFAGNAMKAFPALLVSAMLNDCPFMVYAGQELGEAGMDEEGFSGLDGRTTIFDYWGVGTLQSWTCSGKYDGANMSEESSIIRDYYQKVLNLVHSEKALAKGKMYDLQYLNLRNADYNPHKQFAWFRYAGKELILVVVNFDAGSVDVALQLNSQVLQYLAIEENTIFRAEDLLGDFCFNGVFSESVKIPCNIPGYNGRVLKISY
jgi:glycosidase